MSIKDLIKAEIDRVEDESLDELHFLVKQFAGRGGARGEGEMTTEPSPLYVGSPRLVHREQAADFKKEVVEDRDDAGL